MDGFLKLFLFQREPARRYYFIVMYVPFMLYHHSRPVVMLLFGSDAPDGSYAD